MEELDKKIMAEISKRGLKADVYIEDNRRTEVAVNDGAVERVMEADSFGIGLRVFKGGKMGFGFSTLKASSEVPSLFDKVEKAVYVEGYGDYDMKKSPAILKINMTDKSQRSVTIKQKQDRALSLEAGVKNSSPRIKFVRDTTCVDNYMKVTYLNSAGADYSFDRTYSYIYTSAVASDGKTDEVVDGFDGSVEWSGIDAEKLGDLTGKRAAGLLGGTPVASGRHTLILPSYVAVEFLQVISPMFFGSNLRKGKTLLKDAKAGDILAPVFVDILDNALMDGAAGSFPVDGEGNPGLEKKVISGGKFSTFLYDSISAAHYNLKPTGNGVRSSYKALPESGVSNFYMAPGRDKAGDIMKLENSILVNSMMGLHMTDTVSGNFSLGMNGWIVKNGEKARAVKEVLITGNIKDFLSSICMAGDDLKFYFNFGSPTIAVKEIMVAGK